jgi:hypothetical protein
MSFMFFSKMEGVSCLGYSTCQEYVSHLQQFGEGMYHQPEYLSLTDKEGEPEEITTDECL